MSEFLLEILVRSLILSAIWLGVAFAVRKRSAAAQHAWLVCGIVGLLCLPILHGLIREIQVALLPSLPAAPEPKDVLVPGTLALAEGPERIHPTVGFPWGLSLLSLVWTGGSVLILSRYLLGLAQVQKWYRLGERIDASAIGIPIVASSAVSVPITAWMGRSIILVPDTWRSWTAEKQDAVLRHELAHIQRRDWLTQLVSSLTCATLWPNPAVWLLAKKSRFLAERSADDVVLSGGLAPIRYAQILLETAKEAHAALPQLSVAVAQRPHVARRIELILHPTTNRASISKTGLLAGALLVLGTAVPVAVMALTHRESPKGSHQGTIAKESVQFLIECCVPKPGALFSDTGLEVFAETRSVKQKHSAVQGLVYAFPMDSAQKIIAKWKKDDRIASNPSIRTLSGMPAVIKTSNSSEGSQTLKFSPSVTSKGDLKMECDFQMKQGDSTTFAESFTYTCKLPGTVVISKMTGPNKPKEVLAVVTVKVVK